jgi:hypothetical protein
MRQFNEFSALFRAPLFSRAFFQDVALRWKGIGVRYLMLVLFLCWLVVFIKLTIGFTLFINTDAQAALKDFPPMTLRAGRLSSPVPQPHIFRDENGKPIAVLDTTGTVRNPSDVGVRILITATEYIDESRGVRQVRSLSGFPDMTLDETSAMGWLRLIRNLMLPVMFPLFWAFSLAWRLLVALLFAAIGLGIASAYKARISYAGLLRLAAVSMTSVVFLDTIFWLFSVPTGCWTWFLYPVISLGYMTYGIHVTAPLAPRPVAATFALEPNQPLYPPPPRNF